MCGSEPVCETCGVKHGTDVGAVWVRGELEGEFEGRDRPPFPSTPSPHHSLFNSHIRTLSILFFNQKKCWQWQRPRREEWWCGTRCRSSSVTLHSETQHVTRFPLSFPSFLRVGPSVRTIADRTAHRFWVLARTVPINVALPTDERQMQESRKKEKKL